jgi:energy-coupling factor transporter ATP-binding protein EcfA2
MSPSATSADTADADTRTGSAILHVHRLSLTYPFQRAPTLRDVSFQIVPGERALLLGPSGCGKSSLALCLNGIIPQSVPATLSGRITLAGLPANERSPGEWAATIAYVFQDTDSQLCTLTVEDEIAFALENRNLPPAEIAWRIDHTLDQVGLPRHWRKARTQRLSGGEKQKLLLAAALAQDAALYVFDEVTSQLDPASTATAYRLIERLIAVRPDRSALFVDHRLDALLRVIDRVHLFDAAGRLILSETPAKLFHCHHALVAATGAWRPMAADLFHCLRAKGLDLPERPLAMAEVPAIFDRFVRRQPKGESNRLQMVVGDWIAASQISVGSRGKSGAPMLSVERIGYAPHGGPPILQEISLALHGGEILGLVGANGAGKSTLGLILAGLLRPSRGIVARANGGAQLGGFVFQNPEHQFVAGTVAEEIGASLTGNKTVTSGTDPRVEAALRLIGLWDKRDLHPFELSQGEKRRLSVLTMTTEAARSVLVLDEPSFGLDAAGLATLTRQIAGLRQPDRAVVLITHDMDLAAALCDRLAVMANGRIMRLASPAAIFRDRRLLQTAGLAPPTAQPVHDWLGGGHG